VATTTNEELRQLTAEELTGKLREAKEEHIQPSFSKRLPVNSKAMVRLGAVRKEIARIYTIIRERELGIGGAA
jgi:large subunit ribosomal protein L29